jgi:hypothetical protein
MSELWELVWGKPEVDPAALAQAIERELDAETPDFRTRLLIRDGTNALENHWGAKRVHEWLSNSPVRARIEAIKKEDLGQPGFPMLKEQLMDKTEPDTVNEFLRELGTRVNEPTTLAVGGSIALILTGYLSRATSDLDVVDEVPSAIRLQRELLEELQKRYRLLLTHFQSHYLPSGWESRLKHLGKFGSIEVQLVDVYDIFLGKLFSSRTKDLDDLRAIKPRLDKTLLEKQLVSTTAALTKEPSLRASAEKNWYILFGEKLPLLSQD